MLTMVLGGLWHGAAWTFVVWGAHPRRRASSRSAGSTTAASPGSPAPTAALPWWHPWVGRLITFNLVCLAWVFFRADSFHLRVRGARPPLPPGLAGAVQPDARARHRGVDRLAVRARQRHRVAPGDVLAHAPVWQQSFALSGWLLLTNVLGPVGIAPFIYFQF